MATDSSLGFHFAGALVDGHGRTSLAKRPDALGELPGRPRFSLPLAIFIGLLFLAGVFTHWRKGINLSREKK
jgi:hypothetical protein